jgi:hypothetical protein
VLWKGHHTCSYWQLWSYEICTHTICDGKVVRPDQLFALKFLGTKYYYSRDISYRKAHVVPTSPIAYGFGFDDSLYYHKQ